MPLRSKMATPRGSLAPIDIQREKHNKKSSPKTQGPELLNFVCSYV